MNMGTPPWAAEAPSLNRLSKDQSIEGTLPASPVHLYHHHSETAPLSQSGQVPEEPLHAKIKKVKVLGMIISPFYQTDETM